jgi:hypothetical protein
MIFQPFINIANWLLNLIVSNMDTVELAIPDGVYSAMDLLFSDLGFLFPVKLLLPILVVSFTLGMARLIVAVVVRIKSFIPTMGN